MVMEVPGKKGEEERSGEWLDNIRNELSERASPSVVAFIA